LLLKMSKLFIRVPDSYIVLINRTLGVYFAYYPQVYAHYHYHFLRAITMRSNNGFCSQPCK
jgi:hypothetical protein